VLLLVSRILFFSSRARLPAFRWRLSQLAAFSVW